MRRLLLVLFLLTLCLGAGAQTAPPSKKQQELKNYGTSGSISVPRTLGRTAGSAAGREMGFGALPADNAAYPDKRLKAIEKQMNDRMWEEEKTAWEKASGLGTKEAYRKYLAKYPDGEHATEARSRIIDIEVNDIFRESHNKLPQLQLVRSDPDSPASTISIHNETGMPLTVMFSGTDSKTVVIGPGMKGSVTVTNGIYKIAASVPSAGIRPFAGESTFSGGYYEVGFWIVRGAYP